MASTVTTCDYCGVEFPISVSHLNRSNRIGAPNYCCQTHAGIARRKPEEEKKTRIAEYGRRRRVELADEIKRKKREHYLRTVDREKQRAVRQANMPRHVEYCRKPEYKAKKVAYDIELRKAEYGEYGDAYRILLELENELRQRYTSAYERQKARGYYDPERVQQRR